MFLSHLIVMLRGQRHNIITIISQTSNLCIKIMNSNNINIYFWWTRCYALIWFVCCTQTLAAASWIISSLSNSSSEQFSLINTFNALFHTRRRHTRLFLFILFCCCTAHEPKNSDHIYSSHSSYICIYVHFFFVLHLSFWKKKELWCLLRIFML